MQTILSIRVQKEDIDYLGHMNYTRYIHYFEMGISDWYRKADVPISESQGNHLGTVVVHFDINYIKEARLGETLKVMTIPVQLGTKSFSFKQTIFNEKEELITECTKKFVMFDTSIRKGIPVIEEIAKHFSEEKHS
ncbi:MAG: acyl-CoA thioesterase [Bacillus sp. (in: firmicutes)]